MPRIIYISLFAFLLLAACTPDTTCRMDEHVRMKVVFAVDKIDEDGINGTVSTLDSLTVNGLGRDSILYNNAKNIEAVSVPLQVNAQDTRFVLTMGKRESVLIVYHTPNPYFVSLACGCFVYHTVHSVQVTGDLVERAEIVNASVENMEQDNVRLYIRL